MRKLMIAVVVAMLVGLVGIMAASASELNMNSETFMTVVDLCCKGAAKCDKPCKVDCCKPKCKPACEPKCKMDCCKPKCKPACEPKCKPKCEQKCCKPKCAPKCKPACEPKCEKKCCTPKPCEPCPKKCCPEAPNEYPDACRGSEDEFVRDGTSRQDA